MANVPRPGSRRLRDSWPDSRRTFNTSNVWPRRRWNGWVTVAEPKERLASSAVRWVCVNLAGSGLHDGRRRWCWNRSSRPTFPRNSMPTAPGRNTQQAVVEVEELVFRGHREVVDADL